MDWDMHDGVNLDQNGMLVLSTSSVSQNLVLTGQSTKGLTRT